MLGEVIKVNTLDVNLIRVIDGYFNNILLKEPETLGVPYINKINTITKFYHSWDVQIRNQDIVDYYLEISDQGTSSNNSGPQTQVEYNFDITNYYEQPDWFKGALEQPLYRRLRAVDQDSNFDITINITGGNIPHDDTINITGDFTFNPGAITSDGYFDLFFEISFDGIDYWYDVGKIATLEHWVG